LLLMPPGACAAEPKIGAIVVSHDKDASQSEERFQPDTGQIYLSAQLIDLPQGARVGSTWIAVATSVAPPDYVIDAAEITVSGRVNVANFALSRPGNGWPAGSYRVDLTINGRPAGSASFRVGP
jgi:hypothetical protein